MNNHQLKRITAFLFVLMVALFLVDQSVRHLVTHCPEGNVRKVAAVMNHRMDANIVIWGASTARVHFDSKMIAEKTNMSCFNMGLGGTPFHQYNGLLKEFTDYTDSAKVLILALDINGFASRDALYQGYAWTPFAGNDNIYESLRDIDSDLIFKSRYVPLYFITALDRRFLPRSLKSTYFSRGYDELANGGFHPSRVKWNGTRQKRYLKPFSSLIDNKVVSKMMNVIHHAKMKRIRVAIVVTPCHGDALALLSNLEEYESALDTFRKLDVPVFNYLDRQRWKDDELFSDFTHLNERGASVFSDMFSSDIAAWILSTSAKKQ